MKDNMNIDFELNEEDFKYLQSLDKIENYGKSEIFPCYKEGK